MIIKVFNGRSINTATDLGPEERHILQKLMAWESMVNSLDQFREIKKKALARGWNNSGPVRESRALSQVVKHFEFRICQRLKNLPTPQNGDTHDPIDD